MNVMKRGRIIAILFAVQAITVDASVQEATFTIITDLQTTLSPLTAAWTDICLPSCATNCLMLKGLCHGFIYNEDTQTCTLGTWLTPSNQLRTGGGDKLYAQKLCHTSNGFVVLQNETISACLRLSLVKLPFVSAKGACEAEGGHLAAIKSLEKAAMVKELMKDDGVWVGLDDQAEEGVFRFHDDGSVLTSAQIATLFPDGEPNDYDGDEDCVTFSHSVIPPLNDDQCDKDFYFMCEISDN